MSPREKMDWDGVSCFQIIQSLDIGFLLLHLPTKKIVNINRHAMELIGNLDRSELIDVFEIEKPLVQEKRIQSKVRLGDNVIGYTVYPATDGHVAVLFNDITEKERLKEMAEATAMMDNVAYILAGFSHEVGNPLNSIKTLTSVLKENIENFSTEKVSEYLESILSEVGRIEYLLRMFKVFRSYEDLEIQLVNIRVFFERFLKLVERDMKKRSIQFQIQYIKDDPLYAVCDERALQQIMLNVLTNAMDAVSSVENPSIKVVVSGSERNVVISVVDNGIGISPEVRDKLFMPFYTTKAKGTGMGLTIVKNLLTRMKGGIEIRSLERGTEVRILIPNSI